MNKTRIEAARASDLANSQTEVDVATFTQWVDAYARKEPVLANFYFRRFRKEFKPAVNAWLSSKPLANANALTPFAMPQYRLAATAEAETLDRRAQTIGAITRSSHGRIRSTRGSLDVFGVPAGSVPVSTLEVETRLRRSL